MQIRVTPESVAVTISAGEIYTAQRHVNGEIWRLTGGVDARLVGRSAGSVTDALVMVGLDMAKCRYFRKGMVSDD